MLVVPIAITVGGTTMRTMRIALLTFAACTGPAGPEGPTGPAGSIAGSGAINSIATSDGMGGINWQSSANLSGLNVMGMIGVNTTAPAFDTHVIQTSNSGLALERYGGSPGLVFRQAGGSQQMPLPSTVTLGQIRFAGFSAPSNTFATSKLAVEIVSAEPSATGWTDTSQGSMVQIYTTQIGHTDNHVRLRVSEAGHIGEYGPTPALSACGTGATLANGADSNGVVSVGTTATGCTITFASPYNTAPTCMISSRAGSVFSYTVSTTAITITGATLSSSQLDYICHGF
jgi:hypothetical protein